MPYKSRKVRNKNCYKVYKNDKTKKVFAKCSTKENAQRQMRLLRAIQNNKNFKPNARRNMGGKSRKNKTLKKKGGVTNRPGSTFVAPRPLVTGSRIRIGIGEYVNIIDTTRIVQIQEVGWITHSLDYPIEGIIIGQVTIVQEGQSPYFYYHMVVTQGYGQIQAGTSVYLLTDLYNANTHVPITRDRDTSDEEKRNDDDPGNGTLGAIDIPA